MRHIWEIDEVDAGFWSGNMKERNTLEDLGVDGKILKWLFKWDWEALTGLIWPRIGIVGGCL